MTRTQLNYHTFAPYKKKFTKEFFPRKACSQTRGPATTASRMLWIEPWLTSAGGL